MSFTRPLIICLLIACLWLTSMARSPVAGPPHRANCQKGKGKCTVGDKCPAGYECRTERITVTFRFPECSDLRSEILTRTGEWKNATDFSNIQGANLRDFYTEDSVFLLQNASLFTGPPGGRSDTEVKVFVGIANGFLNQGLATVEDIVYFNDDLILSLNVYEFRNPSIADDTAYELVLWKREEGIMKVAVTTLNVVSAQ
ncbi:uncharacterized protein LOC135464971 [Liolophura sinensis]|uniref:uncharacterized protein LOC135464971 n=1 Tax=Liolophura sinensis TaxID=3198878 RepID=UPI0031586E43